MKYPKDPNAVKRSSCAPVEGAAATLEAVDDVEFTIAERRWRRIHSEGRSGRRHRNIW